MYTIYINDKPFIICDDWDHLIHNKSYLHYYNNDGDFITKTSKDFLQATNKVGAVMHTSNAIKAFELFSQNYDVIEAAGGVIENELKQILMIFRRGFWDMPKGKIEKGETEISAAKREVIEECGINQVEVKSKIGTTYHTFNMYGKNVLKISHWYRMVISSTEKLKPQTEEDITEIKWFDKNGPELKKLEAYKSIHEILNLYLNKK